MLSQDKPDPKDSPQGSSETRRQNILPTAPLPESISKNIETIIALHRRSEKDIPRHQRVVETVSAFFGRPAFLYSILLGIILWITPNVLPRRFGIPRFDPLPFSWLQFSLTAGSLLVTTGVLIKQERQEKLAEQRTQLILQLNLLSEQKIAKLIGLLEELRQDIPNVKNRSDPEAEMMKSPTDPHAIIDVLEETLASELASFSQQQTSIEE
ncbi:DUF1003 domain-containing protein [Nostoc sp. 'Lobaria pulmonaria (5183) cyanobiont']|uniref:DUF1003 domain-containing protein n=1 Tax=Nostoc sp. 'Lobaria pulmonaria (5183) cyanobiont' TaxID=1618022 RepID=UPI000CF32968|nr:DUF1003 domain-containing protein [Nostoc sp. 'Lobaria pulmonaria (5183) cyanobiont']AVH69173.1 protein of unknown function DUF1003 [Nostoc sp. 'Lobaria pulmonaria (5183) cyanobiont']